METIKCGGITYPAYIIEAYGQKECVYLVKNKYRNGNGLAIDVMCIGEDGFPELYGSLTVSIPGYPAKEGYAFLKTYSENREWAEALARKAGARPTGVVVTNNFGVQFPLWDFGDVQFEAADA